MWCHKSRWRKGVNNSVDVADGAGKMKIENGPLIGHWWPLWAVSVVRWGEDWPERVQERNIGGNIGGIGGIDSDFRQLTWWVCCKGQQRNEMVTGRGNLVLSLLHWACQAAQNGSLLSIRVHHQQLTVGLGYGLGWPVYCLRDLHVFSLYVRSKNYFSISAYH